MVPMLFLFRRYHLLLSAALSKVAFLPVCVVCFDLEAKTKYESMDKLLLREEKRR
jgi:hypothetical protein